VTQPPEGSPYGEFVPHTSPRYQGAVCYVGINKRKNDYKKLSELHRQMIEYYLIDMDVLEICPVKTLMNEIADDDNLLFSQPGMLYIQTEVCWIQYYKMRDENLNRCLMNSEINKRIESHFGAVIGKCVLYLGATQCKDNGIEFENIDEYLKNLPRKRALI
jgi:hypothetical protein